MYGLHLFSFLNTPEDSTAWLSGLNQYITGKTVAGGLDGILDIRAQGGAFALCRLSMSIKQRAAFLSCPKSIPGIMDIGGSWCIVCVQACVCVCVCEYM